MVTPRITFINRKIALLFCILTLLLGGAKTTPSRLMRLTVQNKSERKIEISLTGQTWEKFYYLRVPSGSEEFPAEKTFTVYPDFYAASVHYVEYWDPVYGFDCSDRGQALNLTHNAKLVVLECNKTNSRIRRLSTPAQASAQLETGVTPAPRGWGWNQPD